LAQSFLKEFAREHDKPVREFSPEALQALLSYSWPGNVRELRSEIERAVVLCQKERIERHDLSPEAQGKPIVESAQPILEGGLTVDEAEKQLITRALAECGGNRTLAAKKIGISRRTLHRKLHQYHLEGF
jgi:DNA-binding NtrC family response regulator